MLFLHTESKIVYRSEEPDKAIVPTTPEEAISLIRETLNQIGSRYWQTLLLGDVPCTFDKYEAYHICQSLSVEFEDAQAYLQQLIEAKVIEEAPF